MNQFSSDKPQIFTPPAFEDFRGYLTLEDNTLMQWCVDQDFCGEAACAVRYDDPSLIWKGSEWPEGKYIISKKDENAMWLKELL